MNISHFVIKRDQRYSSIVVANTAQCKFEMALPKILKINFEIHLYTVFATEFEIYLTLNTIIQSFTDKATLKHYTNILVTISL